ncbi:MAG: response regulator transcription factor [Bacteroidales bacterium]|nr:response regulator transcription factor [Bacteroidales bacterium]MBN2748117.1 response regulator transcription factor [Bacteroidales bacterium]
MRTLIIEDEKPAVAMLQLLLKQYDPHIDVVANTTTVASSVAWLRANAHAVDIVFMDIQLADGLSFEIFKQVAIAQPIVFTTAFDEYAIEAFKVNSIDYLLKPIKFDDLVRSMNKLKALTALQPPPVPASYTDLIKALSQSRQSYLTRIMVRVGEHIKAFRVDDIVLFYAEGRTVFLVTQEKRRYVLDNTLEELTANLNPEQFFRCNRSAILNLNHVVDAVVYSSTRLKIRLTVDFDEDIVVSRERVAPFKAWFAGGVE